MKKLLIVLTLFGASVQLDAGFFGSYRNNTVGFNCEMIDCVNGRYQPPLTGKPVPVERLISKSGHSGEKAKKLLIEQARSEDKLLLVKHLKALGRGIHKDVSSSHQALAVSAHVEDAQGFVKEALY